MTKIYRFAAKIDAEAALRRIKDLLTAEGVTFEQVGPTVRSTRTPVVIVGIQTRLYSRRNWVGLNPFVFVSGVAISVHSPGNSMAVVEVSINRLRTYLLALAWIALGYVVGKAAPHPVGTLLFIGVVLSAWLGIVLFLGGYLVRGEIYRAID